MKLLFYQVIKEEQTFKRFLPFIVDESLDEPDSPFDTTPPSYREISKIINKMKSSGSAFPFDHVSVIALKRCPILRTGLHFIIVYCWTKKVTPVTWKKGFCVLI